MTITKINPRDAEILQKISVETFTETFSSDNDEAEFQNYLGEKLSLKQLKSELENPNSEFYLLKINEEAAGYLKLNFKDAQSENQDENAMEIERIYVVNKFQRQKFGQLLLGKAVEIGKKKNAPYIWLGVWEKNEKAINFYRKNGFEIFGSHIFKIGKDEQKDFLMKLKY